jgi:hypothetical protein
MDLATRLLRGGYKTALHYRRKAERRRSRLADLGLCINAASHGPATHGVRCERCAQVHKRSA